MMSEGSRPRGILPRMRIGEVIRNGVVFNPENAQGDFVSAESLIETVARFFLLLRGRRVEYVLVGGIALLQYVEGRNTEDIDLIMALSSLERFPVFFFNDTATTEIYTLSLHDALPISRSSATSQRGHAAAQGRPREIRAT